MKMKKYFTSTALILLLFLSSGFAAAADKSERQADAAVRGLLKQSGVQGHIANMPSIIARALEQRQKELSLGPDGIDYTVITRMLEQTYSEPAMTDRTVANLVKGYDPNRYAYLQQVFASAPVQRLQKSKQGLQAPDKAEEISRWHNANPLLPARSELIAQLDAVTAESQFVAGVQALSAVAMFNVVQAGEAPDRPLPEQSLLEQSYQFYARTSREQTQAMLAYALRDVADEDVKKMIAAHQELPVQWFIEQAINAMSNAVLDPLPEIAAQIRKARK
ncbi:MAG: hypothetical protein A2V90_09215 [Gammaproteobacteria bacterium RBG_16_57_12]|nr:MAG: hypothetical protein A2V90_09215 [Gammaproteobacteria bacterium RBG_16_57_12]